MSIIEKAMRKLNGGRAQPRQRTTSSNPKIVEHPASPRATEHPDAVSQMPKQRVLPQQIPAENTSSTHRVTRLQVAGIATSEHLTPQVAEEFRRIKRPLIANAYGKGALQVDRGNLIMVTSSVPGEGKSTTSVNLAYSIALEPDYSVLLIDADVAKAQVSRMFRVERMPGLTNILSEHLQPEELIWRTESTRVDVLPVGNRHSQSTELLNSSQMEQLVHSLAEQDPNRIIILDAPPLLATNEPQVLAHLVGQIVLVVEAGRTPQHVVKEAIAALDPAKAIGLVLNKSEYSVGGDYYGHYYGGYYAYGGERDNERSKKVTGK